MSERLGRLRRSLRRLVGGFQQSIPKEDTGRSWVRPIASDDEVPAEFHEFLRTIPAAELTPFPYCALTPTFRGICRRLEIAKLVILTCSRLYVAEARENGVRGNGYPLGGILTLEQGVVLLH